MPNGRSVQDEKTPLAVIKAEAGWRFAYAVDTTGDCVVHCRLGDRQCCNTRSPGRMTEAARHTCGRRCADAVQRAEYVGAHDPDPVGQNAGRGRAPAGVEAGMPGKSVGAHRLRCTHRHSAHSDPCSREHALAPCVAGPCIALWPAVVVLPGKRGNTMREGRP